MARSTLCLLSSPNCLVDPVCVQVKACTKCFPEAYIRLVAFDSVRQVQITGFLVHRCAPPAPRPPHYCTLPRLHVVSSVYVPLSYQKSSVTLCNSHA